MHLERFAIAYECRGDDERVPVIDEPQMAE
jgi:hypothetical protein